MSTAFPLPITIYLVNGHLVGLSSMIVPILELRLMNWGMGWGCLRAMGQRAFT